MSVPPERRTMRGWFEYLDDPKREFTLLEFMALMQFNSREYLLQLLRLATDAHGSQQHIEGMVGALDLFAAQLAEQAGFPYAASATVRAALSEQRQRLAALEAKNGKAPAVHEEHPHAHV